ncbi:SPASM domain-containing protein [Ruminococcus sp.]|uniref:SPASM domain-containing protein n=1 Tax=Ruminococcus sp. TaxID=41978 RepID=UPI0025FC3FA2|nr:SPASM domain-containing protein [Ruminococcus sp.]MBR1433063.1 radical SAM protein [Ruminococcus sp.]
MRYAVEDKKYHFKYAFDTETGMYIRTGILDESGKDTGVDPFMGSFPHLIDVGIMGHCIHGKTGLCSKAGFGCYQSGMLVEKPNMTVEDFEWIASQCKGRTNQFALGGRGDPDQHEQFEEILKISRKYNIIPSFTTSGYGMTESIAEICKRYCGAVAVSWYRSEYTTKALDMLISKGIQTNIHYVLGNNSIDEAIRRLRENDFPKGINAVIFLIHKPVGQGTNANVLRFDDPRVKEFYAEIDAIHPFRVGVDSCNTPGVINFCKEIDMGSVDTCEGGRFGCYISSDMVMVPCSFDQEQRYRVQLRPTTIEEAWNSDMFEQFRGHMRNACPGCKDRTQCLGGCPLLSDIILCSRAARTV